MPRPKGRGRPKKKKTTDYSVYKSADDTRIQKCKKSLTRKCESDFMKKAFKQVFDEDGGKLGGNGKFSQAQVKEALKRAGELRKNSKLSPAFKRYLSSHYGTRGGQANRKKAKLRARK